MRRVGRTANALVLKTSVLTDLQVRILHPPPSFTFSEIERCCPYWYNYDNEDYTT